MKKLAAFIVLCAMVQLHCHAAPADAPHYQLTIDLRDGSRVIGQALDDTLSFHSDLLGDKTLPLSGIASIQCADGTNAACLTAVNGDKLTVQLAASTLSVQTSFGKAELPVNLIQDIQVDQAKSALVSSLVALWSGESNAVDSVSGHSAKLEGNVAFARGRIGKAFLFDGKDAWVNIGNPAQLHLQDFTITAWIKRGSNTSVSGSNHAAVLFGYRHGGYSLFLNNSGRPQLAKNNDADIATWPDAAIKDTHWHHLVVTKSGSAVIFYVDGVAYPAPAFKLKFTFYADASIGGKSTPFFHDNFLGRLDEVGVFNRALSPSEIHTLYIERSSSVPLPVVSSSN